jgi:ubiquinone/menaquinone biosynthesis C-methylase UbiE
VTSEISRSAGPQLEGLEPRKLAEIEHSRNRRQVLKGYERTLDTHESERAAHADELIGDQTAFQSHGANLKFYSITASSDAFQRQWIEQRCGRGTRVLDFACGNGENGIFAASCGAEVIGIDISPEGIENANANALAAGVADHCRFEVMDGERMSFADSQFDIAVEYGALHHMELDQAMRELARILNPGGAMICTEALRHNPIIHWYRKRTPHLRTAWEVEHILGVEKLETFHKYFEKIEVRFFHLFALAAVLFRRTGVFQPLRKFLDSIDRAVLSDPRFGKYAWIMIAIASNPRK